MKELYPALSGSFVYPSEPFYFDPDREELPDCLEKEMDSRRVSDMENGITHAKGVEIPCHTSFTSWFISQV